MVANTMRVAADQTRAMPRKINFTVKSLAALKVSPGKKKRVWAYDSRTPHLAYMVTDTGSRSFYWYGREKDNPKPIRKYLGDGTLAIEQARRLAAKQTAAVADGKTPHADRRKASAGFTLGQLWTWYLDNHAKPKKRSWGKDQERYTKHLSHWASRRMKDISTEDVARLHVKIGAKAPGAANRTIALLRGMFNKAMKHLGFVGANPAEDVSPYPEHQRERYLSAEELPRFFEALKLVSQDMQDFLLLCLLTGARRGNVLAMEWSELDVQGATWTIPLAKFKTGRQMEVPLVGDALKIINRRMKSRQPSIDGKPWYVFPSEGKLGHIQEPKKAWARICEAAELKDLWIHDLRRTLGSWQAAGGTSLNIIGKSLGHTQAATTQIYARLDLSPVKASVGRAVDAMMAAATRRKVEPSALPAIDPSRRSDT